MAFGHQHAGLGAPSEHQQQQHQQQEATPNGWGQAQIIHPVTANAPGPGLESFALVLGHSGEVCVKRPCLRSTPNLIAGQINKLEYLTRENNMQDSVIGCLSQSV